MNVLLTGPNGFVGSHILDELVRCGWDVHILLRTTSDTRFIQARMSQVRAFYGSLEDARSIREALDGVDVVIHCAGKTKAVRRRDYYAVNVGGTRNVVEACNAYARSLKQLILISSLAVSGPGTADRPATEDARPRPVSHYGKSKWLAERCVRRRCQVPTTILRPAAVYGPRDADLYLVFRAVRSGFAPLLDGGLQRVSLIYVRDVAAGVLKFVGCEQALGKTYHLAHPVAWPQKDIALRIAGVMGRKVAQVFVPGIALYPVCLAHHLASVITGKAGILNLDKIAEYSAPGWVCTTDRAAEDIGFVAATSLEEGIRQTVEWYEAEGWLPGS